MSNTVSTIAVTQIERRTRRPTPMGARHDSFMAKMGEVFGDDPPAGLVDVDSPDYFMLTPAVLADQIIYVIDQPWGISISDVTVRGTGDSYMI